MKKTCFAGSVIALAVLVPDEASASWTVTTVDTTVGSQLISPHSAIGYGHNFSGIEVLHVAYQKRHEAANYQMIYYTSKTGSAPWTTPIPIDLGSRPRIVMGGLAGETPILAYTKSIGDGVHYAYPSADGSCGTPTKRFHCEYVTGSSGATEVAVTPGSVLFDLGSRLVHADQGAPWTLFDIHSVTYSYDHPSMDFRSSGADVMAFSSGNQAFFRTGYDTAYDMQDVGIASSTINYTDIDVDAQDVIRMAFNNWIYTRNGTSWTGRTFTTQSVPNRASIATTPNGQFGSHVAVAWGDANGLHINGSPAPNARPQTFDIDRVAVGPVDSVGAGTNRFAIVYKDATNDVLKVAVGFY